MRQFKTLANQVLSSGYTYVSVLDVYINPWLRSALAYQEAFKTIAPKRKLFAERERAWIEKKVTLDL